MQYHVTIQYHTSYTNLPLKDDQNMSKHIVIFICCAASSFNFQNSTTTQQEAKMSTPL